MINIINQIFEIEQKLKARADNIADRNFKRIYHELNEMGYKIIDPINRVYKETDTDLEVSISGELKGNLTVTKVLKPVIYQETNANTALLLQKGIVIIEGLES